MNARTAIILAAGLGARLVPSGHAVPKGLLTLGTRPIIEESIGQLFAAGVERIVMGVGFGREPFEAMARGSEGRITTCVNPVFADSGSMFTLALCAAQVPDAGDVLVVESDLVYEPRALDALQSLSGPGLLVSGFTGAGDEVFVKADDDGRLVALSKDRASLGGGVIGELVGLTRLTADGLREAVATAEPLFAQTRHIDYEQMLATVSATRPMPCVYLHDLAWTEIDDARHLERARQVVYPRIVAARARRP